MRPFLELKEKFIYFLCKQIAKSLTWQHNRLKSENVVNPDQISFIPFSEFEKGYFICEFNIVDESQFYSE